jgi:hypothetical protein
LGEVHLFAIAMLNESALLISSAAPLVNLCTHQAL